MSTSNRSHPVHNPSTGQIVANISCADLHDVNNAVQSAVTAFNDGQGEWPTMTGEQRANILKAMALVVSDHSLDLAKIETMNTGKPLKETIWDVEDVAGCFQYFAEQAVRVEGKQDERVHCAMDQDFRCSLQYMPVGVVGAVIPWNYPLLMAAWKLAPALASGSTVVIKPSELTPLSLIELFRFWSEEIEDLPDGVLNLITGDGQTGAFLVSHPDIDKVAFTGSVATGSKIMSSCTERIANITLELGGKSPLIIFDDVSSIDDAVEWALFGCFWTNGQICSATSRVLVQDSIYNAFITRLVEITKKIPAINPNDEAHAETQGAIGPVISKGQYDRVNYFIQTAKDEEGATVLFGGNRPEDKPEGYYITPTLIEVTDTNVTVWNEEIFGPVMSILRFNSEDEAVKIANDNKFGLAGAVMSSDPETCNRVGRKLRCGVVWKNCSQPCFVQLPWGGLKLSGIGRELGSEGIFEYMETKSVVEYTSSAPWAWYISD